METILTHLVTLAGGGVISTLALRWFDRRKLNAEAFSAETDAVLKIRQMFDETLIEMKRMIKEGQEKDAVISTSQNTISTQKLMLEVAEGTIRKNNDFMKEILIGWGEMKKAEEDCQKRCSDLEKRVRILEGN